MLGQFIYEWGDFKAFKHGGWINERMFKPRKGERKGGGFVWGLKKFNGTIKHVYSNYGSWGGVEGVTKEGSRGLVHCFALEGDICHYGGANFCKLICN